MNLIKTIPKEKKLVIFDFFGTLIGNTELDAYQPKKGVNSLLEILHAEKKILAISSDAPFEDISISFLFDLHKGIYKGWNSYFDGRIYQGWRHIVGYDRYHAVKNLGEILNNCKNIQPSDAIFIGDNDKGRDKRSAEAFGIDFILVKQDTDFLSLYRK